MGSDAGLPTLRTASIWLVPLIVTTPCRCRAHALERAQCDQNMSNVTKVSSVQVDSAISRRFVNALTRNGEARSLRSGWGGMLSKGYRVRYTRLLARHRGAHRFWSCRSLPWLRRRRPPPQLRPTKAVSSPTSVSASTTPMGSRSGPDGALWFTNYGQQLDRADHHRRGGHQLHRHRHRRARGDHGRSRRGAVVHQLRQQLDRADHHRRGRSPTTPAPASTTRRASRPAPTARCGSPTTATTRSGGSPPPGWSPTTPAPASTTRTGSRPGPDGALWFTNFGNNSIGRITTAGVVTNYTGTGIDEPDGDHGRARRGAVVHQLRQQLDRADHHRRGRSPTTPAPASTSPHGITAGPDGALWFTNYGNNSIGRITTAGVVTNYTGPGIDGPDGITAGPDGALWFTNYGNNSIGRITTAGGRHQLHRRRHRRPDGITAGPDGALWFTNDGNNSIGRITTAGVGHQLHRHRHRRSRRDHGRPRRGPVVHQLRQQLDRADHHRRGGHQLHRHRHRRARRASRPAPTGRCGSPTPATTRSGGSPPPGWSPTTPAPASTTRTGSPPAPTGPCGSPTTATTRSGGSPPPGVVTNYTGTGIDDPAGSRPAPTGRCGSPTTRASTELDRADHHLGGRHHLTPAPASARRRDHRRAPTARCGSRTTGPLGSLPGRSGGSPPRGS